MNKNKRELVLLLIKDGKKVDQISEKTGVSRTSIWRIKKELASSQASSNPINLQSNSNTKKASRTRNFATVIYPTKEEYEEYYSKHCFNSSTGELLPHYEGNEGYGSHPENWLTILEEMHIPALISPMHCFDHNPTGELKKPHWHVELLFAGVKNFDTQVKPIFEKIGGVGREMIESVEGYTRYLVHMDNPEKFQYSASEVIELSGACFQEIVETSADIDLAIQKIVLIINEKKIFEFNALLLYLMEKGEKNLLRIATRKATYAITKCIDSARNENRDEFIIELQQALAEARKKFETSEEEKAELKDKIFELQNKILEVEKLPKTNSKVEKLSFENSNLKS